VGFDSIELFGLNRKNRKRMRRRTMRRKKKWKRRTVKGVGNGKRKREVIKIDYFIVIRISEESVGCKTQIF
jgi:hypothetical protein